MNKIFKNKFAKFKVKNAKWNFAKAANRPSKSGRLYVYCFGTIASFCAKLCNCVMQRRTTTSLFKEVCFPQIKDQMSNVFFNFHTKISTVVYCLFIFYAEKQFTIAHLSNFEKG